MRVVPKRNTIPQVSFGRAFLLAFICVLGTVLPLLAWPTTAQWRPLLRQGIPVQDPNGDTNGSRNVVSDATHPAAYVYNDGSYLFFRMRLDQDPTGTGGQGALQAFGWGVVIDTNQNAGDYEFMIMLDGIDKSENIALRQNTSQGTLGDPSDAAEVLLSSIPLTGNHVVSPADTSFNGSQDYFLDWRFSYASFKTWTGLGDTSPIRLFEGSSPSAGNLRENGGDLLGASDLFSGFSDFVTPMGIAATNAAIRFVDNLAGTSEVTSAVPGDTLFLLVSDIDRNQNPIAAETVSISLTTTTGDEETLTLTETGPNTGVFTTSLPSLSTGTPTKGDKKVQAVVGTIATATFLDLTTASGTTNVTRTATLGFRGSGPPQLSLTKSTSTPAAKPGAEIIYTLLYKNTGAGEARDLTITDQIPAFTTYLPGSLRLGGPTSAYADAAPKTDAADADEAEIASGVILLRLPSLAPNAEGKVFFKVILN